MGFISCLHISDLHIGEMNNAGVEGFYTQICTDIKNNQQKIDYIIFSGDIIYGICDNKNELLKEAIKFFKNLLKRINKTSICNNTLTEENFVFVPGNHDILRSEADIYSFYKKFLKDFYGETIYEKLYNQKHLYTIRIDKEKKIAIVGLNSCAIKKSISERDEKWIKNLSLKGKGISSTIEDKVKKLLISSKEEVDDYGEISVEQLNDAFDELYNEIGNLNDYRILATFHHHIYPFPEIYSKYGDSSMIRNFAVVIDYFLSRHVSVILHGHKHTSISRPLTNNKFYNDSKRMIHVFSAGTIGSDRGSKSYQVVEIHSLNDTIDVQTTKYIYEGIEFQNTENITFPPKETNLIATFNILDILRSRNCDLHEQYTRLILLKDKKSEQYKVGEIINAISNTITTFKDIRNYLEKQPDIIFLLLLIIHYRILVHDEISSNKKMLEQIRIALKNFYGNDDNYVNDIFDLLQTTKWNNYFKKYKAIQEKIDYLKYKKETAFIIATTHLLDLYLTLGYYGEVYFKKEGIYSKVNFKLEEEIFNENLPIPFLKIAGEEDRRTATVTFKCLNPTVHKTAVLIIKDFEEKISIIEDSFKEIGLKIYYIRPRITPSGYELENYSFEAYIPKLLPLLTGEHLYKQKEVFVRELIQNSLDAILLREKIDVSDFDKDIEITIGETNKDDKTIKYLKIQDHGVGMDQYKIERYFTSIGRSFYTSDDYKELLQEKNVKFKAISNFGIGFLSVFMVAYSVKVKTKSYDSEKEAIDMDIPNYEGCFFVKKDNSISQVGTEIVLFEGEKKKIDHKKVIKYILDNIININLNVRINNEIENKYYNVERNSLFKSLIKEKEFLFIPINEDGLVNISYEQMKKSIDQYQYGIMIVLDGSGKSVLMNSGIKVSARTRELKIGIDDNYFDSDSPFDLYYFFPSSFVQLDVSRERILFFKSKEKDSSIHKTANGIFCNQACDYIKLLKSTKSDKKLSIINSLDELLTINKENAVGKEKYWIGISFKNNDYIELSFHSDTYILNKDICYICDNKINNEQVLINIANTIFGDFFEGNDKASEKEIKMRLDKFHHRRSLFFTNEKNVAFTNDFIHNNEIIFFDEYCEHDLAKSLNHLFIDLLHYEYIISKNRKDISNRVFYYFYNNCCRLISFGQVTNYQFKVDFDRIKKKIKIER